MTAEIGKDLLGQYANHMVTVWYAPYPKASVSIESLDSRLFASLEDAIRSIKSDTTHMNFVVRVHLADQKDRRISADELQALLKALDKG